MEKKTKKEILDFWHEFTFNDHYNNERVLEINRVRDCKIDILSESDFKHEDNRIKVMGFIFERTLKVIDRIAEKIKHDKCKLWMLLYKCYV